MTNTLVDQSVLVSKFFFTATFPIEDNLKAKNYPCESSTGAVAEWIEPVQATFYVPPELNHSSGKIPRCALGGSLAPCLSHL